MKAKHNIKAMAKGKVKVGGKATNKAPMRPGKSGGKAISLKGIKGKTVASKGAKALAKVKF